MMQIEDIYQHYLNASGVTTDTRQIVKDNIFFALRGENFDGNTYAMQALEKDAGLVIIDNKKYYAESPKCILVEDSLLCLQQLATHHRKQLKIPFIGLTGTNGKTTSKELIHRVLSKKYKTHATHGNFNNHIGVPLTVLGIPADAEMAVIEMGANHIGEIALLCKIADPDLGMITNIGKAHLQGFGSFQGVIEAKTELYDHILNKDGKVLVNADDPLLMDLSSKLQRITYGKSRTADFLADLISSVPILEIKWNEKVIKTHLYGDYNFENVMTAVSFGEIFHVDHSDIADAISSYKPDNSRSQLVKSNLNTIYLDAYNANPSSMIASIRNFEMQKANNKAILLGDMLELGESSQAEHQKIAKAVINKFDTVILVGPEFMKTGNISGVNTFVDTDAAAEWLKDNPIANSHILVKGSRGIALENLLDYL
jgi:UDP-N-acetylmuramoyl-tripeptide--D-alanyl-D-alanine ligase